jgi:hypothetical protein
MAQIVPVISTEHDAIGAKQSVVAEFLVLGPTCRTVGGDVARLPRTDDRHHEGGGDGDDAASKKETEPIRDKAIMEQAIEKRM